MVFILKTTAAPPTSQLNFVQLTQPALATIQMVFRQQIATNLRSCDPAWLPGVDDFFTTSEITEPMLAAALAYRENGGQCANNSQATTRHSFQLES